MQPVIPISVQGYPPLVPLPLGLERTHVVLRLSYGGREEQKRVTCLFRLLISSSRRIQLAMRGDRIADSNHYGRHWWSHSPARPEVWFFPGLPGRAATAVSRSRPAE